MSEKPIVTKEDMKRGLAEVGIVTGDLVLAHSSLSSFGFVEGGPDTAINALLETVGPEGTIVVPTFTWGEFHNAEIAVLDVKNKSVKAEVGAIPETFRKRPEAQRSIHMCHSVAAIGPLADKVMGEGIRSFGEGSTFHQLYELNAWCLLFGATFNSCTELHAVEEYMAVPYRYHRDFKGSTVILEDGTEIPSESVEFLRYTDPDWRNDFGKMREVYIEHGVTHTAQVGNAEIMNTRIRDIFDIAVGYMKEDIGYLLNEDSRRLLHEQMG